MNVKGIVLLGLAAIGCKDAPKGGAPPPPEVAVV